MRAAPSRASRSPLLAAGRPPRVPREPDAQERGLAAQSNSTSSAYAAESLPRAPPSEPNTPSRADPGLG